MIESAIAWFVPLAALAAFSSPALVATHKPAWYKTFFYLLSTLGNLAIMCVGGAWTFYDAGYRAALASVGSNRQPAWLAGLEPAHLLGIMLCFWVFLFGVWLYGLIRLKD